MKKALLLTGLLLTVAVSTMAQKPQNKLIAQQKGQEKTIKTALKQKKVSPNEYEKLMKEQEVIKNFIGQSDADGVWTSKELNALYGKLERAEKRLKRYKTNGEIY